MSVWGGVGEGEGRGGEGGVCVLQDRLMGVVGVGADTAFPPPAPRRALPKPSSLPLSPPLSRASSSTACSCP